MKNQYVFSILRYVHDPVTQEFANVGVVACDLENRILLAKCTQQYSRVSKLFGGKVDGVRLRRTLSFIERKVNAVGNELHTSLRFETPKNLALLLSTILPADDSALQFHSAGGGLSNDLAVTMEKLFLQYVEKYAPVPDHGRDDAAVWKTFKSRFEQTRVIQHLQPKVIEAPDFDFRFDHTWRNGVVNCLEPLSFDLISAEAMADKANRWIGRATGLRDSREEFKLYFLLGSPQNPHLRQAFEKATNLLHKMPVPHDFIPESDAESFGRHMAAEMKAHGISI